MLEWLVAQAGVQATQYAAGGLAAVALALRFIKTEDLVAIGNVFAGLGALAMAGGNFGDVGKGMDMVVKKMDNMDSENVSSLAKAINKKGNAVFKPLSNIAAGGGASRPVEVVLELGPGERGKFVGLIKGMTGGSNVAGRIRGRA